jgi:DNA-binding HxlR family transcriptional regulator
VQRTQFGNMVCSIARTLDIIGEPWSPLILRDVMVGICRFDQIQADLGISRKVLTQRLTWLVDCRVLERRQYSARPPRDDYVLTEKGLDLCDLLLVMVRFGDRWTAGDDGPPVVYRHHTCGHVAQVDLRCSQCHEPMHVDNIDVLPGPALATASS